MSRWRKSSRPCLRQEHGNQGMKEEDKGSNEAKFRISRAVRSPCSLGRKNASLACLLTVVPLIKDKLGMSPWHASYYRTRINDPRVLMSLALR